MAGAGARDIKRKIKSVSNTRQITKAMELVSTAKLRKAKSKLDITKPYFDTVLETINKIVKNETNLKHKYLVEREKSNTLYVIITADRGLCGGYNSNVLKKAVNIIENNDTNAKIVTVGKQALKFFKDSPHKIVKSLTQISEEPSFNDAKQISNLALKMYDEEIVDEIVFVYKRMITSLNLEPTELTLLPVSVDIEEEKETKKNIKENKKEREMRDLVNYEPSAEVVLDFIIPKYIESVIYGGLIESSASEQSARRIAMESATDNADEMIEELTLTYNQARQAAITQEITEIVGGAEALK
jgi:F-type H+-transporting ATPase subunit gamma